jgi:hypothetical protein
LAALIAIDPELDALEWEKAALAGLFPRIHIFQRCESGITRIRQYLGRGELPVVLLSARAHDDDGVDVDDLGGLVARLRTQAPQMPILVIHEDAEPAPAGVEAADQVVKRPTTGRLKAARAARKREEAAHALREALQPWAARSKGRDRGGRPGSGAAAPGGGAEATDGQGGSPPPSPEPPEPSAPGDVLRGVLALAAQAFNRVALFLCTDEGLVGMAQVGLARAGGPPDARFRELRVDPREPSWFRTVIETGQAICSAPRDEADFRLVQLLGTAAPPEAYLAPIAGGGRVVALIYGDNLPEAKPAGDTTALEIALHQAGQALDRALGLRLPAAGEGAPRGAPEEI